MHLLEYMFKMCMNIMYIISLEYKWYIYFLPYTCMIYIFYNVNWENSLHTFFIILKLSNNIIYFMISSYSLKTKISVAEQLTNF